jgi:cystathionine beta-lyase/cystathionine gamma-synthase
MLEERIALMEGAEACRTQASGMGAMSSAMLCQLSAGDHMVIAKAAFGPTRWVTDNLLPRFGIECTPVDGRDLNQWQDAIRPNTKLFFFETPPTPRWIWWTLPKFRRSPMRAASAWWWTMPLPAWRCSARWITAPMWWPMPPPS